MSLLWRQNMGDMSSLWRQNAIMSLFWRQNVGIKSSLWRQNMKCRQFGDKTERQRRLYGDKMKNNIINCNNVLTLSLHYAII